MFCFYNSAKIFNSFTVDPLSECFPSLVNINIADVNTVVHHILHECVHIPVLWNATSVDYAEQCPECVLESHGTAWGNLTYSDLLSVLGLTSMAN